MFAIHFNSFNCNWTRKNWKKEKKCSKRSGSHWTGLCSIFRFELTFENIYLYDRWRMHNGNRQIEMAPYANAMSAWTKTAPKTKRANKFELDTIKHNDLLIFNPAGKRCQKPCRSHSYPFYRSDIEFPNPNNIICTFWLCSLCFEHSISVMQHTLTQEEAKQSNKTNSIPPSEWLFSIRMRMLFVQKHPFVVVHWSSSPITANLWNHKGRRREISTFLF